MTTKAAWRPVSGLAIIKDMAAGGVVGLIGIASSCSFAAMIFAGPFAPDLGRGIVVMLVTAVIVGVLISLRSGFPYAIGGPDNNATAIYALMAGTLAPTALTLAPADRFPFLMTVFAAASFIVGLALLVIGWRRLARIARFVPFPVVGGFMAATGWLVVVGAVRVATEVPLSWGTLPDLARADTLAKLGATGALVIALGVVSRVFRSPLASPIFLVIAVLGIHAALPFADMSIAEAQARGLLLQVIDGGAWWTPFQSHPAALTPEVLLAPVGDMVALIVVMALAVLMNGTGLELESRTEANLDHELRVHGMAGMVSAMLGGLAGNLSLSRSTLNRRAGATSRLSGLTMVLMMGGVLVVGMDVVGLLPRVVLAALLARAGLYLLWTWGIAAGRHLPTTDRLTILSIVLLAATFGFLPALAFGVVAGCIIFVLDVSRVSIIRHNFGVNEFPSTLMRADGEMAILDRHGGKVQVVVLSSFIFFGSAHRLYERVQNILLGKHPRIMVFDFSAVTGVDSSAGAAFFKIRHALHEAGALQLVAGLPPDVLNRLHRTGGLPDDAIHFATLDEALEYAENLVLSENASTAGPPEHMMDWLARALRSTAKADRLRGVLSRIELAPGAYLCQAGDPTDAMHFVECGRISVLVNRPGAEPLRVRGIGRHAVVGEMGLFLDQPRSASLRADEPTVVWALSTEQWRRLEAKDMEVAMALLAYLVRLQSERLGFATRQISALQR